jgi:hypothetical protein
MMLVVRIQSSARGIRMNTYSPVGDQNPSRAQFVLRRMKRAATATPPQLSHTGIIPVRMSPREAAKKNTALGIAATTSRPHVRLKSACTTSSSPARATECARIPLIAVVAS